MLLGSTVTKDTSTDTDPLVLELIFQRRYSEAYELLTIEKPASNASLYNMALCFHWSGNFQEALKALESIQLAPMVSSGNKFNANNDYQQIRSKQNQTDDYLQGVSNRYVKHFPALFHDAIVRLKTACWLKLGNYPKVVTTAQPIAHKGYKNIIDALKLAEIANDKRI